MIRIISLIKKIVENIREQRNWNKKNVWKRTWKNCEIRKG